MERFPVKILVCEDYTSFLKQIRDAAAMQGVTSITETSSLDALTAVAESREHFDIVILDGQLGDKTSMPFVERVVAGMYPHLRESLFVFISSDEAFRQKQLRFLEEDPGGYGPYKAIEIDKSHLFKGIYHLLAPKQSPSS